MNVTKLEELPSKGDGITLDPSLNKLRVLTAAKASALTTISIPGLERHRKAGTGPRFIRLGARRVGYRLADLEAWIEANTEGGEQAA